MSVAIIPGSFDPMTVGHVDVIERASKIFDRVIVMVMVNREKKYMFSIEERTEFAKLSCSHLSNVEVMCSEGMLIDVVDELGANVIIKGVRSVKDFSYEQVQAYWNKEHNPKAETMYLPSNPKFKRVSSTMVRKLIDEGKRLDGVLMPAVISRLKADKN